MLTPASGLVLMFSCGSVGAFSTIEPRIINALKSSSLSKSKNPNSCLAYIAIWHIFVKRCLVLGDIFVKRWVILPIGV